MRSMVEGARASALAKDLAITQMLSGCAPATAFGGPPPPLRGGGICWPRRTP
jgi:hypothetical protein